KPANLCKYERRKILHSKWTGHETVNDALNDLSFTSGEQRAIRDYSTELKFALVSFCASFIIVCSKLVLINRALFQKAYIYSKKYWISSSFGSYKLLSDESKTKISELLLSSDSVVRDFLGHFNWLLLPLLAGLGMTALTWCMIYVDSCIPGVKPPTPFSPNKNR
ncbi:hypothetical protein ANN_19291, partial [Periplaneta americana]